MNNGKICVSVCAGTADEMITKIKLAEELADVIEVRFDCLLPDQLGVLRSEISNLKLEKLLLATFRDTRQGGKNFYTFDERAEFLQNTQGFFAAVDIEEDFIDYVFDCNNRILSFHDFNGDSDGLDVIYERLSSTVADVVKIAVQTKDVTDSLPVWKLLERAKKDNKNIIPIAMGEAGKWTRILGLAHGSYMTYASLNAGQETAAGQITAKDLKEVYRVKELDLNTKVYGVIGDPVAESLSPYIHNPAFVEQKINAVFIPLQVKNLDEFIRRMVRRETREVELNFAGFAVTMPHKQAIIKHLDGVDPIAEKIGAVNTVNIKNGKLIGYNTDAYGFITPLKETFSNIEDARVAVFGAGGAARACVFALKQENADVTVFARDMKQANLFANEFDVEISEISNLKFQIAKSVSDNFDIIVNATPLGMKGDLENETLLTADDLKGVKCVYDLVTSPTDTPLIAEAKRANVPTLGGIEMLIHQGAKQFEIWTGREAPLDLMRKSVEEKTK